MENKRFERSRRNRVIAGVCAGLANYFNLDIALVRVLFVVAALCGSFGFWMYIILWIVAPDENLLEQGSSNTNEKKYDEPIDITPKTENRANNGAMIASLILIFIGLVALINNFMSITWIWKLWPLALIIIGVVILINSLKNDEYEQ